MTLDKLLDLAYLTIANGDSPAAMTLARGIALLLGEAWPCGYEEPIVSPGRAVITLHDLGAVAASEARAIAAGLLRAADEANATPADVVAALRAP